MTMMYVFCGAEERNRGYALPMKALILDFC